MNEMISIVVPVYKAKDYIAQTIKNVIAQTYTDWELILIEDASGDGTDKTIIDFVNSINSFSFQNEKEDIYTWQCVENKSTIRLKVKKSNEGAAAARNTGLDIAAGRYIAFLDADDVWMPTRLEKTLGYMQQNKCGFVFSAYEFGDENANGTGRIVHVPNTLTYKQALSRTVIFTTTTLFDTEIVPVELIHMPKVPSEDTATWWQILRAGFTAYGIDEVLAIYRRPAASLSSNKLVAIKRIWNLYTKVEGLSFFGAIIPFIGWAYRATVRRI